MALSEKERKRWQMIDTIIAENKNELKQATTHTVLKEFAEEQGWMNKNDFGKFKVSLRKLGVDYEQLREETFKELDLKRAKELDALDDSAPCVYLMTGAVDDESSGTGSFAIIGEDGEAYWYGAFFGDDLTYNPGDLVSAEQSVAEKAVWFAAKCLREKGIECGRVEITTTCPDLDETTLKSRGVRLGVKVGVHVNDEDLRAVDMAEAPGFKKWQENDLASLVMVDEEE